MMPDRQMLLDLGLPPSLSRDDLIVSSSNRAAVELVDRWPDWAAPHAIIAGPPGSGKTHLATIWRLRSDAHALADPSRPGADDIEAARSGRSVLCDGLAHEAIDEAAFFHLLNVVRQSGGTLLVTALSAPAHWPLSTADLRSRFRAAMLAELLPPDDALLSAVAVKLFADRQVVVDRAVIDYLLARVERSVSAMNAMVARLDRAALERKSGVTRALVAQLLRRDDADQGALDL